LSLSNMFFSFSFITLIRRVMMRQQIFFFVLTSRVHHHGISTVNQELVAGSISRGFPNREVSGI
jgi:hypothetical protein